MGGTLKYYNKTYVRGQRESGSSSILVRRVQVMTYVFHQDNTASLINKLYECVIYYYIATTQSYHAFSV